MANAPVNRRLWLRPAKPRLAVTPAAVDSAGDGSLVLVGSSERIRTLAANRHGQLFHPEATGDFAKVPLQHVARGVYSVTLPADAISGDLEYHVRARYGLGSNAVGAPRRGTLSFPATAPSLNQSVVVAAAN